MDWESQNVTEGTLDGKPPRFSMAVAKRAIFLVGVGAGLLALVANGAYAAAFIVAEVVGVALAVIVMVRRQGSTFVRLRAAVTFLAWGTFLAAYFACFPSLWQAALTQGGENGLDVLFSLICLLGSLPLVVVALVLALRGWTWAVHDWARRHRH